MADDMPSGLVIFLLGFGLLLIFVLFLWALNTLPGKVREIMSRSVVGSDKMYAGVERVLHQVSEPVSVSAKPNTEDTEPVSGAAGATPIDTAARDIIRASLIAELLDSGLLTNRDKAIIQAFHCSKAASTRPDAPFQIALRLVEQHRTKPAGTPEFKPLTAEQQAIREQLGLDKRGTA